MQNEFKEQRNDDQAAERDRHLVAKIRDDARRREEIARELFFEHFARIERTIQARLCLHGVVYDAGSEGYNSVFEAVYERVFTPESLCRAVRDFDSEKGSLENWLLARIVFVVRDWLKSSRYIHPRHLPNGTEQFSNDSTPETDDAEQSVLEAGLTTMSAPQRASTVLRLLPTRDPTDDDVRTICEVAGRQCDEIQEQINALAQQFRGDDLGIREQRLLTALTCWHARRCHQQRLYHHCRQILIQYGESDDLLVALETLAAGDTQEGIRARYRTARESGKEDAEKIRRREHFERCCHDLAYCTRRLEQLAREYSGAKSVPLVSYGKIAEVLCSTVAKVTAYLHRARLHLEEEQMRRNVTA